MNFTQLGYILLGVLFGLILCTPIIIFYSMKKRSSQDPTNSQQASAAQKSRVKQVGRDMVRIGSYTHTQTQLFQGQDLALVRGEQIATSATVTEFQSQVDSMWSAAKEYVHGVSLYGKPFLPERSILESILTAGVEVRLVLVDPDSPAAREIAEDKCRFSRTLQHYEVLAQTLAITELDPKLVLDRIKQQVNATLELRNSILDKYPTVQFSISQIDFLPVWKGTIVDGSTGVYLIYDVPRMDVPFRFSDDRDILSYYEKHYFVPFWNAGRKITKGDEKV